MGATAWPREHKSALRGNCLLELYPNRPVAPLISYTRETMNKSKYVIGLTVFCRCKAKILPPCESEVIPLHHIIIPQNTTSSPSNAARFHSSLAGSARSRHPSPFTNHDPILINSMINSNVNKNPRFSGSRSAPSCRSDVRAGHHGLYG